MECKYLVTRRAGRKHEPRPSMTAATTLAQPSSSASPDPGASPVPTQHSSLQQSIDFQDFSASAASPTDNSSWWTTLGTEMDDFFVSPLGFQSPDATDWDTSLQSLFSLAEDLGTNNSTKEDFYFNDASHHMQEGSVMVLDDSSGSTKSSKQASLLDHDPHPSGALGWESHLGPPSFQAGSSCGCLLRVLGLFKHLFRSTAMACQCSKEQGDDHIDSPSLPTIQAVIAENEQTIETVTAVLQCPCSQDSYLLAIISLVIFKVLAWYAAAARDTPVTVSEQGQNSDDKLQANPRRPSLCHSEQVLHSPAPMIGRSPVKGEDQARAAAKLVLSELHRVQRLVNELSQRLGAFNGQGSIRDCDEDLAHPLSATMLHLLEAGMRKRLRKLSLGIVEMLRRG